MSSAAPRQQLLQMLTGYWSTQMVYVAAKLRLADLTASAPRTADELAAATQTHAPSLFRLLRALASIGVLSQDEADRFAPTELGSLLRDDVPGSQRALAIMNGEEHFLTWGQLLHSVQTGDTGFEKVYGEPVFDFLATRPEQGAVFDAAMTAIHGRETQAMLDAYDFAGIGTLADIGGGNGSTLAAVLARYPSMQGVLFDMPAVAARTRQRIAGTDVAPRLQIVEGDFFQSVPSADAYLLRHIIHDWDDARSLKILQSCRAAVSPQGRLLIVESVIPAGPVPGFGKLLDVTMLVITGGKERTETEYRDLLDRAGYRLQRIVPTAAEVAVVEAVPV